MKIIVSLFTDRTLVGSLGIGPKSYPVCADSHTSQAVPTGSYQLVLALVVPSDNPLRAELGPKVLLFECLATKRVVALHAGFTDARGSFLATDCSLRVGYEDVCKIAGKAKKSTDPVTLIITERVADSATKLLGVRASEAYTPSASVRSAVARFHGKGSHWAKLGKHYDALGCTLCQRR